MRRLPTEPQRRRVPRARHLLAFALLAPGLLLPAAPVAGQYLSDADSFAVASAALTLRAEPWSGAPVTGELPVGGLVRAGVLSTDSAWRAVRGLGIAGWAPADSLIAYDLTDPYRAHAQLARRWLEREDVSFAQLAALVDALTLRIGTALVAYHDLSELEYLRYRLLQRALDLHARLWIEGQQDEWESARAWLLLHDHEIMYGEPQGQWLVDPELAWMIAESAVDPALAEEIAWYAANQTIPGECEGYMPCVYHMTEGRYGRYLASHPFGQHAALALERLAESLEYMAEHVSADFGHEDFCDEVVRSGIIEELQITLEDSQPVAERDRALVAVAALSASCGRPTDWRKT